MANNGVVDLPMLTLEVSTGARAAITLPSLQAQGSGSTRWNNADLTLPQLIAQAVGGAQSSVSLPALQTNGRATVSVSGRADILLPALQLDADVTVQGLARSSLTLPMLTVSSRGGGGAVLALPSLAVIASGTVSLAARAALTIPALQMEARATKSVRASAEIVLPMLRPVPSINGDLTLPSLLVQANASLVVAVTYEGYAINLLPGEGMPNQVTRYTAWPFNQIVRWGDDYYGISDTGIYLLGGDADAGAPINWRLRTGITNFGSRQKKQVRETFVHGRLGPSVTAKVSVGEAADQTYAALIERNNVAQAHRIKYGRGLQAQFWSFELTDATGSQFELHGLQHQPVESTRKV